MSAASRPDTMSAIARPPMRTSMTPEGSSDVVRVDPAVVCIANQMS